MPRQFGKADISTSWPPCPDCPHRHALETPCPPTNVWLIRRFPQGRSDVIWLKRPMPDGQWPPLGPDRPELPVDDSFNWWVRAHCGHTGGAIQYAFYEEKDADVYEHVFRDDPCRWTRCPASRRAAR